MTATATDAELPEGSPVEAPGGTRTHGVRGYVLRRLGQAVIVLFLVVTIVFGMSHLAANPADILLPPGSSPQLRAAVTKSFGLDRPLVVQYWIYLGHIVRGDLGVSTLFHVKVVPLVAHRSLATAKLALAAMIWATALGIPIGAYLAHHQGSIVDRVAGVLIALAQGVASFWLGILLMFAFAVKLGWLPVSGDHGPRSIILPAVALGLEPFVSLIRLTRSAMIETLSSEYYRNARARGIRQHLLTARHALRGALPPVITYGGILFGQLIAGAVITETIFAWPGIGQLSVLAINNGDYALVEGVTLYAAIAMILINLAVDLVYLALDPEVREKVAVGGRI